MPSRPEKRLGRCAASRSVLAEHRQEILALVGVGNGSLRSHESGIRIVQTVLEHLRLDVAAALVKVETELVNLGAELVEALNGIDEVRVILLEHLHGLTVDELSGLVVVVLAGHKNLLLGQGRSLGIQRGVDVATVTAPIPAHEQEEDNDEEQPRAAAAETVVIDCREVCEGVVVVHVCCTMSL